jgi:two-component system nitrogen regulation sensor histidine kinase GlnL
MPFAWADQSRLRIALTELVKNACEAIQPTGTVHIRCASTDTPPAQAVSASEESAPSKWITISVIDDGRGITPDIDEQIYLPFITTKKRDTIAGLGLTVAAGCMEQIGGVITHESCPGRTIFRLTVPAVRTRPEDSAA